MTSYIVDLVLLAALLFTSFRMGAVHRELKRLRTLHAEYRLVFDQTATALADAHSAVQTLAHDGRKTADTLGARIDQAQALVGRFEAMVLPAFLQAPKLERQVTLSDVLQAPTMIPIVLAGLTETATDICHPDYRARSTPGADGWLPGPTLQPIVPPVAERPRRPNTF